MMDQEPPKLTRLEKQVLNDVSYLLDKKHGKDKRFLSQTQKKKILENLFVEYGRTRGKKLKEEKLYQSEKIKTKVLSNDWVNRETTAQFLGLSLNGLTNINPVMTFLDCHKKVNREVYYRSDRIVRVQQFINRYGWSLNRIKDHLKESEEFRDMFKKLRHKSYAGPHCTLLYPTMVKNGWYKK